MELELQRKPALVTGADIRFRPAIAIAFAIILLGTASPAFAEVPAPRIVTDPQGAASGDYKLDPHHASVTIKLSHMGLSFYTLRFDGIEGHFAYDPAHPSASEVAVTIDPRSIDTGDKAFDQLIVTRYLEADKFPVIRFASTRIGPTVDAGAVEGLLDFHGVKRPVVLQVNYRGFTSMENEQRMGFSGETTFKRSDFGVSAYVPLEGDEVKVMIEVEFIRSKSP